MPAATNPFPYFPEAATGGFIYIGAANQDAQTNPVTVYRDEALTIPWVQPIRTVDGYPAFQGAQSNIYTAATSFSITIKDANAQTQVYALNAASMADVDGTFLKGRTTPIVASKAQVQWVRDQPGAEYPPEDMGGLWTDNVYYSHAINAEFDATNSPVNTPLSSPAVTLLLTSHNKGSDAIVIPLQCIAGVDANNKEAANANFITYSESGTTNVKLKGLEIDIQPAASGSISEAFGLAINCFTKPIPGPAIYIEGIFGGRWSTGIIVGNLSDIGAALSPAGPIGGVPPSMGTLIDTGSATYAIDAIKLNTDHKIRFVGSGGNSSKIFIDANNFWKFILAGNSLTFRDPTDTSTLVSVGLNGNVSLEAGGMLEFTSDQAVPTAAAGSNTLPTNPVGFLRVKIAGTNRFIPYYA